MKEIQLSEHFKLSEFTRSETAQRNYITNNPDTQVIENLQNLVSRVLEPARKELNEPIIITSGYRSKKLNKLVGGVYNSQHMFGEAADIRIINADYANKLIAILQKNEYIDQLLYEHSGKTVWIHVSTTTRYPNRKLIRLNYRA